MNSSNGTQGYTPEDLRRIAREIEEETGEFLGLPEDDDAYARKMKITQEILDQESKQGGEDIEIMDAGKGLELLINAVKAKTSAGEPPHNVSLDASSEDIFKAQEEYLATEGDEEARKKFVHALIKVLQAEVHMVQEEARGQAPEDFENDAVYKGELDRLYTTYISEVQSTISAKDPSFDATIAVLSDPELFGTFASHIDKERVPGSASLIFEGMNEQVLEGLKEAVGEELEITFYLARQKYFCARVAEAVTGEREHVAMVEQEYNEKRDTVHRTVKDYAKKKNVELLRRDLLRKARDIFARDLELENEISRHVLSEEKRERVAPTAVRMKASKKGTWKGLVLATGAFFLGLTGDSSRESLEPRQPTYENTLPQGSKPDKEDGAVREASVETRARKHGAIETFQWFLYDMDARGLQHERDTFIKTVLGDDALHLSQPVQALLLAERLGFTAPQGEKEPILFADSQFVFSIEQGRGTFMVAYDNDRRPPQVLVEYPIPGELLTDADFNAEHATITTYHQ